jgi:hypothetical protein
MNRLEESASPVCFWLRAPPLQNRLKHQSLLSPFRHTRLVTRKRVGDFSGFTDRPLMRDNIHALNPQDLPEGL